MSWSLTNLIWPSWTRNAAGENFYDIVAINDWHKMGSNLSMAQNHPILTPAILFVAKLFSQAEFTMERVSSGEEVKANKMLTLFNNPNRYQTRQDFLESLLFIQIAQGVAVVYAKKTPGFKEPDALYILDCDLIKWPDDFDKANFRAFNDSILDKEITYDETGQNEKIKIKDLLFFYDLPNCLDKNPFKVKSRLDGLQQTLLNTKDSLVAKNIILKTNGKELVTGTKEGFPLGDPEKLDIERLFNFDYGLSQKRKRGLVTRANLKWQSLHIALRDLGLDESVKVDGNLIYTALHIPKDILSLEAKKTTYNNFKESMVSYIQNEMQATLNSTIAVFQTLIKDNYRLKGTFEHMPIMQYILKERYEGISLKAKALNDLLMTGIPEEVALEMCGFDKNLELTEIQQLQNGQSSTGQQSQGNSEEKRTLSKVE